MSLACSFSLLSCSRCDPDINTSRTIYQDDEFDDSLQKRSSRASSTTSSNSDNDNHKNSVNSGRISQNSDKADDATRPKCPRHPSLESAANSQGLCNSNHRCFECSRRWSDVWHCWQCPSKTAKKQELFQDHLNSERRRRTTTSSMRSYLEGYQGVCALEDLRVTLPLHQTPTDNLETAGNKNKRRQSKASNELAPQKGGRTRRSLQSTCSTECPASDGSRRRSSSFGPLAESAYMPINEHKSEKTSTGTTVESSSPKLPRRSNAQQGNLSESETNVTSLSLPRWSRNSTQLVHPLQRNSSIGARVAFKLLFRCFCICRKPVLLRSKPTTKRKR